MIKIVSKIFSENWDFGEKIKQEKLSEIIIENIKKIRNYLKKPKIKKSTTNDDMHHGIDYILDWEIPLAFRGRRIPYERYARHGAITLRKTGENGGAAEIYKMINGEYKAKIYVFVWKCGSYAIIDINRWIKSGLLQEKIDKNIEIPNKNPSNKLVPFTYKELNNYKCFIKFYNARQKSLFDFPTYDMEDLFE